MFHGFNISAASTNRVYIYMVLEQNMIKTAAIITKLAMNDLTTSITVAIPERGVNISRCKGSFKARYTSVIFYRFIKIIP